MDVKSVYGAQKRKRRLFLLSTISLLAVTAVAGLCIGSEMVSFPDMLVSIGNALFPDIFEPAGRWQGPVVIELYAPRVVMAILAGFSLAIAGTVMQSTLRNPLVSPFTLGLSSAAGFGAAVGIVLGPALLGGSYAMGVTFLGMEFTLSNIFVTVLAFATGLLSTVVVLVIGKRMNTSRSVVILTGVIVGYLFQAGITALKYVSGDDSLRGITGWLMGRMWEVDWKAVVIALPVVAVCSILIIKDSQVFNAITAGDDVAKTLGVDVERFRRRSLIIITLAASTCLAFTGIIGFIGLMAPHICRMIIGNDQRFLVPVSGVLGALILLVSDTVSRTILAPIEIPVGVIMYLLGGVFFIYLITRRNGRVLE
ncbi:MAG: iron ABC transporter permease [Candidatus Methanomethylophilaceae archaeon]|nr:iron ABC transporter permease [Candidatus Methanomethylophilaceae archaeon]